jgi:hypothetical protein
MNQPKLSDSHYFVTANPGSTQYVSIENIILMHGFMQNQMPRFHHPPSELVGANYKYFYSRISKIKIVLLTTCKKRYRVFYLCFVTGSFLLLMPVLQSFVTLLQTLSVDVLRAPP